MKKALCVLLLAGCAWGQAQIHHCKSGKPFSADEERNVLGPVVDPYLLADACDSRPEPMDVPAVDEPVESHVVMRGDMVTCSNGGGAVLDRGKPFVYQCGMGRRATCSDKRRVLLTDEGGGKHCILFTK